MPNWKSGASQAVQYGATGAEVGSVIPGIGTLVGGIGGGAYGFLKGLFTKDPNKAQDTTANAMDPILKSLQDQSAASTAQGNQLSGMGADALAPVLDYFKKILGNDPSAMMAATAPQRGRVIDQYDTARKSIANFAPRGGGSSEAFANSYVTEGQDLSALTSQARSEAVTGSAQIGETLSGLGLSADQLASGDLNSVIQAILSNKNLGILQSGQNNQLAGGLAEGLGTLLGLILTRNKTGSPAPAKV